MRKEKKERDIIALACLEGKEERMERHSQGERRKKELPPAEAFSPRKRGVMQFTIVKEEQERSFQGKGRSRRRAIKITGVFIGGGRERKAEKSHVNRREKGDG